MITERFLTEYLWGVSLMLPHYNNGEMFVDIDVVATCKMFPHICDMIKIKYFNFSVHCILLN